MFTRNCTVHSLRGNNTTDISMNELHKGNKKTFIVGTASWSKHSSFYEVTSVAKTIKEDISLLDITFENNAGVKRTVRCTENQMFVTHRGYVNPNNFRKSDVFTDIEGHVNKVVSVVSVNESLVDLYEIELKYNVTTSVNGIRIVGSSNENY